VIANKMLVTHLHTHTYHDEQTQHNILHKLTHRYMIMWYPIQTPENRMIGPVIKTV